MKKSILIILSALLLFMTACQDGTSPSSGSAAVPSAGEPTGSIRIQDIEGGTEAITLSGSMDGGYSIFLKAMPYSGDVLVENVPAGDWIFFLNFTDSSGKVIDYGTRPVTVVNDETTLLYGNFNAPEALPGEAGFQDVLDDWFDGIFDNYEVPEDVDSNGLLIREGTSFLFSLLYYPAPAPFGDVTALDYLTEYSREQLANGNLALDDVIGFLNDLPMDELNEELDGLVDIDWSGLYTDIVFSFQLNMLYYFNSVVIDVLPPTLSGLVSGEAVDSHQVLTLSADITGGNADVEILWYLNGFYIGSTDEADPEIVIDAADGIEGENTISAVVTYDGLALGMESVEFTVEQVSGRLTIAELADEFADSALFSIVESTGLTYADEVTAIDPIMNFSVNLNGLEYLTNLESLTLVETGINTMSQISPLLGLTNLSEIWFLETTADQAFKDALVLALPDCTFHFE